MKKDVEGFLKELTNLSLSYGIIVRGCGCCGSPYLTDQESEEELNGLNYDGLTWTDDHYEISDVYKTEDANPTGTFVRKEG